MEQAGNKPFAGGRTVVRPYIGLEKAYFATIFFFMSPINAYLCDINTTATMRNLLLSVIFTIFGLTCTAQSIDERIANAMNTSDWFALMECQKTPLTLFLKYFREGL